MNTIRRVTYYYTPAAGRAITGIVVHHTATTAAVLPHAGGSWHYAIDRNGAIYLDVPEEHIAWGAAATDRWRPPWVVRSPVAGVSDINGCAIHIELVYAPQAPYLQAPTSAQEASLRALLGDIYARRGRLPVVGHGQVQSDKWETEPDALDWQAIGCGAPTVNGRYFSPPPEEEDDMTPEEQTILDSAARQTAAGNTIANGGDLDWWIGTWKQLASDKESLAQLLQKAQQETAARDARIAELEALLAAPPPDGPPIEEDPVVRISLLTRVHRASGTIVTLPAGFEANG